MTRGDFTAVDALTILLTVQSLLLAAFGIIVVMGAPGQRRPPNLLGGPSLVGAVAVLAQWMIGAGAGLSWSKLFLSDWPKDWSTRVVAISIVGAIVAEALIAALLGWALRPSWKDPGQNR